MFFASVKADGKYTESRFDCIALSITRVELYTSVTLSTLMTALPFGNMYVNPLDIADDSDR